ncbi:hypothetical protein L7F22_066556 [Adiantum nelumboides]|nr:hypothetical protein [Adiantum nelumboides]
MDFTEIQRQLSADKESSAEAEFSLFQVLSLPLEFLVFLVKNRREADLLLKVSESSARLDSFTQNYEMFASRAQALQEAWNGLWLAQEPYLVPAIPLIGLEMSGVNNGRSILLEKMDKEFKALKELGKELCHYIDVNHSLVEELRMEGIERLAINKLLLVEVEKELVRRITHICNNKSVRDLSSMREFLCQLKKPTFVDMKVWVDESKEYGNSTMNGSCSTEKITTDGSSEARQRSLDIASGDRDEISPDSQSFASKCVSTQGDNIHAPCITTLISTFPAKKLDYEQSNLEGIVTSSKGFPLETRALAGAGDIKLHSSSASEERLPKAAHGGHDEILHTNANFEVKEDVYEGTGKKSADFPVNKPQQPDLYGNKMLLQEFSTDTLRSSRLESTQEQAKVDLRIGCDSDVLPFTLLEEKMFRALGDTVLKSFDLDQSNNSESHALPATQPDMKGFKRKRLIDCEAFTGGIQEESGLSAKNCKRIMVQGSSESVRAAVHSCRGTFVTKRKVLHSTEESSHGFFAVGLDENQGGKANTVGLFAVGIPCSCHLPNNEDAVDPKFTMQDRCKECGCFLAHAMVQSNQTACEENANTEQGRVSESPLPFTQ